MRYIPLLCVLGLVGSLGLSWAWQASASAEAQAKAEVQAKAQTQRVAWTTSKVKGSPEPPSPYRLEPAFPKLKFADPLEIVQVPGTTRLAVAERFGKIFTFENKPTTEKADLLGDLKKTVYGLVFHPKFPAEPYVYVTYILDPKESQPKGTRVSRFTVKKEQPPTLDPASELVIIEWPSGGHNGGCIRFGPDGMLYIATGDGSGIADELQTGQNIADLLGSILRIDVDHPVNRKNYSVPGDNPFVSTKNARDEVYAYGLRQVWKFSFDKQSGDLWAGEVGQDLWEMVLKIQKGGNYGWSVQEGTHPFRPERKLGPTPILPPIVEQSHTDFRSITGGYLYRGSRLKELTGAYIYGDYDTGRVWALRHDGTKVTFHQELVDTQLRIVAFAEDTQGELYQLDFIGGGIHRLAPAPKVVTPDNFPKKLSETGLFSSTKDLQPAPGLIPYSVNAQLWSDGAHKERYLALPNLGQIDFDAVEYPQPSPGAPRGWKFPDGTVAVKTFFLEMEAGKPASRRRLETRILHYEQLAGTEEVGDQYWRGYTYVWNDEQTDAVLLEAKGADRTFAIKDPQAPQGERKQTWHFPSRAECTLCHTTPAKYVLGVNTHQLNREHDYGQGVKKNQLAHFQELGVFKKPLPKEPAQLPKLADPENTKEPVADRARAYLHANCAHCHIKWGGGNAEFQMVGTMPLKDLGLLNTKANHGDFKIDNAKVLVPGQPEKSLLLHRMNVLGLGRMPHIASNEIDKKGVQMVQEWIKTLPKE